MFRSIGADFLMACHELDMVVLIGASQPAVREAAAEARPIFERIKARAYLERLDGALAAPLGDVSGARAARRPRRPDLSRRRPGRAGFGSNARAC